MRTTFVVRSFSSLQEFRLSSLHVTFWCMLFWALTLKNIFPYADIRIILIIYLLLHDFAYSNRNTFWESWQEFCTSKHARTTARLEITTTRMAASRLTSFWRRRSKSRGHGILTKIQLRLAKSIFLFGKQVSPRVTFQMLGLSWKHYAYRIFNFIFILLCFTSLLRTLGYR